MSGSELDGLIEALAFLLCADERDATAPGIPAGAQPMIHRIPPDIFDGFEPLTLSGEDDPGILVGVTPADQPIWPVDCAFGFLNPREEDGRDLGGWQFHRWKTLQPREWRGVLHQFHPRMLDHAIMRVEPNGRLQRARFPLALFNDGKLADPRRLTAGMRIDGAAAAYGIDPAYFGQRGMRGGLENDAASVALLGGMMLRKRYHWAVLVGEGSGPRARLLTDVTGMREVFRLRDIPPGRKRRAALLHWVRAHWRKRRDPSANDRAWVKAHLRGAWSYTWNGLRCQIEPAAYDLERPEDNGGAASGVGVLLRTAAG